MPKHGGLCMKIAMAADHAGFNLKEALKKYLISLGYEIMDFGALEIDSNDGFPDFAIPAAKAVGNLTCEKGVFVCGSGIGVSIVANKTKGVNAFNCTCEDFAFLARQHNNTNVICFGERFVKEEDAKKYLEIWLNTDFLGGKYQLRNKKIDAIK